MAFKFIVKDEDLPKPTILSIIHVISIFLGMPVFTLTGTANQPPYTLIIFAVSEFIQIIYLFSFYKKIVWGRYASSKLRTVTISFIATNIFFGVVSLLQFAYGVPLSLTPLIISYLLIFSTTILFTLYLRKIDFLARTKSWFNSLKDFSFPFYKFTAIVPMFLLLAGIFIKSKVYLAFSIGLLALGFCYTALGEYYYTKKKDELDRLIKYEASYTAMQFLPGIAVALFLVQSFFKIHVPWFYVLVVFVLIHALVQAFINKKYE
ncbi:MAG: hypothetical protein M1495_12125 [Bacteroidetes bacterium]|nr:hypothetical protein [Bacteroidota bacterium]